MRVLLHHGAKIDLVTSEGDNAIHLACAESELEATRLLLDGGIDPDIRDGKGNTPLSHAVRGCNGTNTLLVCELLLKHHANPELKTQSAPFRAHSVSTHLLVADLEEAAVHVLWPVPEALKTFSQGTEPNDCVRNQVKIKRTKPAKLGQSLARNCGADLSH